MGNASVKEGENGNGGSAEGSEDRDSGTGSDPQTSMDRMSLSQPESPQLPRSPLMFAPQVFNHPINLYSSFPFFLFLFCSSVCRSLMDAFFFGLTLVNAAIGEMFDLTHCQIWPCKNY